MAEEKGFFKRLVSGLTKTRDNIVSGMDSIFHGFSNIDEDFYEELEEVLIMGDLGVQATEEILDDLRGKVKERHIKEPADCRQILIDSIKEQMDVGETAYEFEDRTSVVMVVGVNGVGENDDHRETGREAPGTEQESHSGCRGHLPGGCGRAA